MSTGEPAATESGHGWFGGGPSEKDQVNWDLVGGLPYVTPGSVGARGVRSPRATRPPVPRSHTPAPINPFRTIPPNQDEKDSLTGMHETHDS
jgi:hypothetical protein